MPYRLPHTFPIPSPEPLPSRKSLKTQQAKTFKDVKKTREGTSPRRRSVIEVVSDLRELVAVDQEDPALWRNLSSWTEDRKPRVVFVGAKDRNLGKARLWLEEFFDFDLVEVHSDRKLGGFRPGDLNVIFKWVKHEHLTAVLGMLIEGQEIIGNRQPAITSVSGAVAAATAAPWFGEAAQMSRAITDRKQDRLRLAEVHKLIARLEVLLGD